MRIEELGRLGLSTLLMDLLRMPSYINDKLYACIVN